MQLVLAAKYIGAAIALGLGGAAIGIAFSFRSFNKWYFT